MRFLTLNILFTIGCLNLFAQDQLNFTDSLGRKQGHWVFYGKDKPQLGIPPETKAEEGEYIDDRKEGEWTKYYEDGKSIKLIGCYVNNKPRGNYQKFWPDGKLREIGCYDKNKNYDSLKRWYENGQLEYEAWFNENGKEHGTVRYYHPNGNIEFNYFAIDGIPNNSFKYDPNGKPIFENEGPIGGCGGPIIEPRVTPLSNEAGGPPPVLPNEPKTNGRTFDPNAYNKIYNEDGEIWQDGTFKDGALWDGKVYVYDRDGILLKVKVFKSGKYYADGQI